MRNEAADESPNSRHARRAYCADGRFGLAKNHALMDGNKRIAAHAMLLFLAVNGIQLDYTQRELADTFLGVADGSIGEEELLRWILRHQV